MKPTTKQINEFLKESNAIERVYDKQSLKDSIRAFGFLMKQAKDGINPYIVMQVHELLMENPGAWSEPSLLPKYRGVLRDCPVYIGRKEAMKHTKIPAALQEWCNIMNATNEFLATSTSESLSQLLHVQYEAIHPFADGNGRTGRMFMNWWRIRNDLPILIIHEGEEQYEYYQWFRNN